jgi:hypothetical protein
MKIIDFYSTLIGFLGGFALAWILLCYKTVKAGRRNKNLERSKTAPSMRHHNNEPE